MKKMHFSSLLFMVVSIAVTSHAQSTVTFFLSEGTDPNGDIPWRKATQAGALPKVEFDLQQYGNGHELDTMRWADNAIYFDLLNADGTVNPQLPTIFFIAGGAGVPYSIDGLTSGRVLLNGSTAPLLLPRMRFSFDKPVVAFGTWVLDDFSENNQFVLTVTETNGMVSVSPVLDDNPGGDAHIDGFIGAVSTVGIESAVLEIQDPSDGSLATTDSFFVDHLQVVYGSKAERQSSPPPPPGAPVPAPLIVTPIPGLSRHWILLPTPGTIAAQPLLFAAWSGAGMN